MLTILPRLLINLFFVAIIHLPSHSAKVTMKLSSDMNPVFLNQNVTISCRSSDTADSVNTQQFSRMIQLRDTVVAEGCSTFFPRYDMNCFENESESHLTIPKVTWSDRGTWTCMQGASSDTVQFSIYVPATQNFLRPSNIDIPEVEQTLAEKTYLPYKKEDIGLGTKTRPYDLRHNRTLELDCSTQCGFPSTNLEWYLSNSTSENIRRIQYSTHDILENDDCVKKNREGFDGESVPGDKLTITASKVKINCHKLDLLNLNKLSCVSTGPQYSKDHSKRPEKFVYILCPIKEQQWILTYGEIAGMIAGGTIAMILLIFTCLVLRGKPHKQNRNNGIYPTPITTIPVNRQQLVTSQMV